VTTKAKKLPSQDYLRSVLSYCPDTGALTWKKRPVDHFATEGTYKAWNSKISGKTAETPHSAGYRQINLDGKVYLAHRFIWVMVHGDLASDDVDHINGDRSDNRLSNLRRVTRTENLRNRKSSNVGKNEVCGVSYAAKHNKYRAYVGVDGKQVHLGWFDDMADAVAARQNANIVYGFTERHGT